MLRLLAVVALVAALAALATFAGCSKRSGEPTMFTGRTLSNNEVVLASNGALTGKLSYAEVNSEWLAWAYADFRRELSAGQFGVVKWDNKSQCTLFASAFEVYCQKRYFAQSFHSGTVADGIAVGTRWYKVSPTMGHAVNMIITERGIVDFEPQSGRFVALNQDQISSSFMKKFD